MVYLSLIMSATHTLLPGITHIGVAVTFFCHDGRGNILLGMRTTKCRDEHGCWDPGGGQVYLGENPRATVDRELQEEYGATALECEFLGFRSVHRQHNKQPTHWISLDYLVRVDPEKIHNNEPEKLSRLEWFPFNSLPTPMHSQWGLALEKYAVIFKKLSRLLL
jgi:8-oxo-dGTP diphosphatase